MLTEPFTGSRHMRPDGRQAVHGVPEERVSDDGKIDRAVSRDSKLVQCIISANLRAGSVVRRYKDCVASVLVEQER